jgi:hypothetical protein
LTEKAGYSGTPLVKKLGIREGFQIAIINEPADYFNLLSGLPGNVIWYKNLNKSNLDMSHLLLSAGKYLATSFPWPRNP